MCVCESKKDSCKPHARVIRYYNYKPSSRIGLKTQQQLGNQQAASSLGLLLFHLFLKDSARPLPNHSERRDEWKAEFRFKVIKAPTHLLNSNSGLFMVYLSLLFNGRNYGFNTWVKLKVCFFFVLKRESHSREMSPVVGFIFVCVRLILLIFTRHTW